MKNESNLQHFSKNIFSIPSERTNINGNKIYNISSTISHTSQGEKQNISDFNDTTSGIKSFITSTNNEGVKSNIDSYNDKINSQYTT